jgi:hypothetical protein
VLLVAAAAAPAAISRESEVELYYELKLLYRKSGWLGTRIVDQWAGGRLLARAMPTGCEGESGSARTCGVRLELVRPLEDPWTFRWYDYRDEIKLGAAVWVPRPHGDPYWVLAEDLTPAARARYRSWWDADRVERTAAARPEWHARTERFWAAAHQNERSYKDPLHEYPVYPFHVLGDAAGRLALEVQADGAVVEASIVERMSGPWLRRGWSDWQAGERRSGYGFWEERERPGWEPRTYQAFAAALRMLAWAVPTGETELVVDLPDGGLPGRAAATLAALSPKAGKRLRWPRSASPRLRIRTDPAGDGVALTASGAPFDLSTAPAVACRVWRHARFGGAPRIPLADEVQLLAEDPTGERLRLWIKVGYRPLDAAQPRGASTGPDSSPLTADPAAAPDR